jgi:CheY-like chemotaxis protein
LEASSPFFFREGILANQLREILSDSSLVRRSCREVRRTVASLLSYLNHDLIESLPSEERFKLISTACAESERLLLTFSALEELADFVNSKHLPTLRTISLNGLIKSLVDRYGVKVADHGMHLKIAIGDYVPDTIITDPDRLRRIVSQLIDNALAFCASGTLEVSFEYFAEEERLLIGVRDEGPGIPPERVAALQEIGFEFNHHNFLPENYFPTSIALTHILARELGGAVEIVSELSLGTCISLILPVKVPANTGVITSCPFIQIPKTKSVLKRELNLLQEIDGTILLMSNDDLMSKLLLFYLQRTRLKVNSVSGKEDLSQVPESKESDIVLVDIDLPDIATTADLLKKFKPNRPLVALMPGFHQGEIDRAMMVGFDSLLSIPFNPERFYRMLEFYLGSNLKAE